MVMEDHLSWEQGAVSWEKPVTAIGLLEMCHTHGAKAVIQTQATSKLGQLMIRLFKENGL